MEKGKLIASQDDCAPDSYPYFDKKMVSHTGLSVVEFKSVSEMTNTEMGCRWTYVGHILCWEHDDPYYELFEAEGE